MKHLFNRENLHPENLSDHRICDEQGGKKNKEINIFCGVSLRILHVMDFQSNNKCIGIFVIVNK